MHSIINRTQSEYLTEIILIDDYSDITNLHEDIEKYIQNFNGLVKLYKTERREGLIRARMFGARKAVGKVSNFIGNILKFIFLLWQTAICVFFIIILTTTKSKY